MRAARCPLLSCPVWHEGMMRLTLFLPLSLVMSTHTHLHLQVQAYASRQLPTTAQEGETAEERRYRLEEEWVERQGEASEYGALWFQVCMWIWEEEEEWVYIQGIRWVRVYVYIYVYVCALSRQTSLA